MSTQIFGNHRDAGCRIPDPRPTILDFGLRAGCRVADPGYRILKTVNWIRFLHRGPTLLVMDAGFQDAGFWCLGPGYWTMGFDSRVS